VASKDVLEADHQEPTGIVAVHSPGALRPASLLRKSIKDLRTAASVAADRNATYKLRASFDRHEK
jgi:hypothetical protein